MAISPEATVTVVVTGTTYILRSFKVDNKVTRMFWFKVKENGSQKLDFAPRGFELEMAEQIDELRQKVKELESLLAAERESNANNVACFEQRITDMNSAKVTKDFISRNVPPNEPQ